MNILDIISLAKAGYTAKDVKELLTMDAQINEEKKVEDPAPDPAPDDEKEIDYKALYESQIEEIEKLKADNLKISDDLKKAQKINAKAPIDNDDNTKTSQSIWEDFLKGR